MAIVRETVSVTVAVRSVMVSVTGVTLSMFSCSRIQCHVTYVSVVVATVVRGLTVETVVDRVDVRAVLVDVTCASCTG